MLYVQVDFFEQTLGASGVVGHFGLEANLEHVVLVGGEGELSFLGVLFVVQDVAARVVHLEVSVVAENVWDVIVALHQDVFVDLFF